jgi:hypothetical protein
VSETEPEPQTILGHLTSVGEELTQVIGHLNKAERHLWHANNIAVIEGRPSVQVAFLHREVQALTQIVGETVFDLVQKSAEVEAKSKG